LDIKSKKSKPFLVWLCFFFGINIVVPLAIISIAGLLSLNDDDQYGLDEFKAILSNDFKGSPEFRQKISILFDDLTGLIVKQDNEATGNVEESSDGTVENLQNLDSEGNNLIYWAQNRSTGKFIANSENDFKITQNGTVTLPDGYDYFLYFDGKKFTAAKGGSPLDVYRNDIGYGRFYLNKYLSESSLKEIPELENCSALLIIKKDIIYNPYSSSSLYQAYKTFKAYKWLLLAGFVVFILGIFMLVYSIINRKTKRMFNMELAKFTGWFWIEVKLIVSIILLTVTVSIPNMHYGHSFGSYFFDIIFIIICFWWFCFMVNDFWINRKAFFANNIINSVIKRYRKIEITKPFQKYMMIRVYVLIAIEAVLIFFLFLFVAATFGGGNGGAFIIPILIVIAIGVYLIYKYLGRYRNSVNDIGKIMEQIEAIKNGDLASRHRINPDADLFIAEENLNRIQEGVGKVVDEKTKSERMKVELVTNVSHDLKTPLTSIISYVDLLTKEEGLPPHVEDYIKILSQKSERLKTLIQDLFDLSKAASGEMSIEKEKLDIVKLIKQTLADMSEQIEQSGLAFKLNLPDEHVFISSDGGKLYRVFLNLFTNCLKYSLLGSRVYVDLAVNGSRVLVTIKNTSNYEMNFAEDEITERFVRGDQARTTEGSGLGLAIARNFTQLCSGSFQVKVDGDLFKVMLSFDITSTL
jgi:Signal transduction histidine kinase